MSNFEVYSDNIVNIIKSTDPNEAHGHGEISIPMIKHALLQFSKPLSILFRNCFESECFPKEWKKAKRVHVHKKIDKQLIKSY